MTEPKLTVSWVDNNADETGHQIFTSPQAFNRGAMTKIKDVAADATSVDLALADIPDGGLSYISVAAVRGGASARSTEQALAAKTPVMAAMLASAVVEDTDRPPEDMIAVPVKGAVRSFANVQATGLSPKDGFTVSPAGTFVQVRGDRVLQINPETGEATHDILPLELRPWGTASVFADDGHLYYIGKSGTKASLIRFSFLTKVATQVYAWSAGTGQSSELVPANIQQGADGRLYLFGGPKFIVGTTMVINSIALDGTAPAEHTFTVPAGWDQGYETVVMLPYNRLIAWLSGQTYVLVVNYLGQPGKTPQLRVEDAGAVMTAGAGATGYSRRTICRRGAMGALINVKGPVVAAFEFVGEAFPLITWPTAFIPDGPSMPECAIDDLFESSMGWLFGSNTLGDVAMTRLDSDPAGTAVFTRAQLGFPSGATVSFARVGTTVYALSAYSDKLWVVPFTVASQWTPCLAYDAAGLVNSNAGGRAASGGQ